MDRHCHIEGCGRKVPVALAREALCLDHFAEMVIAQTDAVRAKCLSAEPIDEATLDWLLSDAPHVIQALSKNPPESEPRNNDRILELLLCLSNLHNYIRHHSLEVKRST